jgi:hypothetical protein
LGKIVPDLATALVTFANPYIPDPSDLANVAVMFFLLFDRILPEAAGAGARNILDDPIVA